MHYTYASIMSTASKVRDAILVPLAPKVKEELRKRADSDGMPMSKILGIFAEKYASGELKISFSVVSSEPPFEDAEAYDRRKADLDSGNNVVSWKEARK